MKNSKDLLLKSGFSKRYQGFQYLALCVELAAEDDSRLCALVKEIYGPVASKYQVPYRSIERDIRTARDYAWQNGGKAFLEEISGCAFCALPTVGELIEILSRHLAETA
ncbi:MAG TPA: sporulation initiation factor Spo0A C-terminal domain-containing protein [Candidatus Scatomonas pullistercoris]|uniref:Sporulation initiation factor Spo0A C-terminal domain-containing protein n=1 Tax=Candidatus Scatomonas pullistercoris TaxID=2840920 RepID=A0A9D1P1G9_9FIRM|nr:sporulation initiation factor Spo0A C-terminal domain-containing protein [Candidatus Scatomonas pullistercoris]